VSDRRTRSYRPHALLAGVYAGAIIAALISGFSLPLPNGADQFNSPGFVVRHAGVKFLWVAGSPFRDDLSRDEEDAKVARFFELNGLIRDDERTAGDPASSAQDVASASARLTSYRQERDELENRVERILEGRLTAVLEELGLTRNAIEEVVWPPVSIEFQDPPSVLVRSPRAEIRKESEDLLQATLSIERVQQIEQGAEADGETSALVVRIGAIAMYPAIIPASSDYHGTLQTIAHEWLHHYLYFAPLGRRYYDSGKLTTLNETVANMGGAEIGDIMYERYPLASVDRAAQPSAAPVQDPAIDFTAEMRGLRRDVESLLAQGRITEAEALMEEKREFLANHGYYIRRLNQAYFAFHGSYADTAGSIDPIGPKLQHLREETGSVSSFIETARGLTSEQDLDAALAVRR
jgi:hypothetical protein